MLKHCLALLAFAPMAASVLPAAAQVPGRTQVGALACTLAPSIGFIVGGHQAMACRFTPSGPFPPQAYSGMINTVGLDIGFSAGGTMGWAVFAPSEGPPAGALAGVYVGATATPASGAWRQRPFGAQRARSLSTPPVEGQIGVNLAVAFRASSSGRCREAVAHSPYSMRVTRPLTFWIGLLAVVIALVVLLREILLPFVAGMVLAYLLDPLANRLERLGMNRLVATLAIMGLFIVVVVVSILLAAPIIVAELTDFIDHFPLYVGQLGELASDPKRPWLRKLVGEGLGSAEQSISQLATVGAIGSPPSCARYGRADGR